MTFGKLLQNRAGNPVIIGLDAHSPNVYGDKENLGKARELLNTLGITPIELNDLRLINWEGKYERL